MMPREAREFIIPAGWTGVAPSIRLQIIVLPRDDRSPRAVRDNHGKELVPRGGTENDAVRGPGTPGRAQRDPVRRPTGGARRCRV